MSNSTRQLTWEEKQQKLQNGIINPTAKAIAEVLGTGFQALTNIIKYQNAELQIFHEVEITFLSGRLDEETLAIAVARLTALRNAASGNLAADVNTAYSEEEKAN